MSILKDIPTVHKNFVSGSGDVELSGGNCVGVYVGNVTGGAVVKLNDQNGTTAQYNGVPIGTTLYGKFTKMVDSGTTATGFVELIRA